MMIDPIEAANNIVRDCLPAEERSKQIFSSIYAKAQELRAAAADCRRQAQELRSQPSLRSGIDTYEDAIAILRAVKRIPRSRGMGLTAVDKVIQQLWYIAAERAEELAPDAQTFDRDRKSAMLCRPKRSDRAA